MASLDVGQYYAHPRNAFWPILFALFDEPLSSDYGVRRQLAMRHGIAIWDSAASCVRKGSLDSNITSAVPNDILALLQDAPTIGHIYFNGQASRKLFTRFYKPVLQQYDSTLLPSTSPAAAMYSFQDKLEQWRCIHEFL